MVTLKKVKNTLKILSKFYCSKSEIRTSVVLAKSILNFLFSNYLSLQYFFSYLQWHVVNDLTENSKMAQTDMLAQIYIEYWSFLGGVYKLGQQFMWSAPGFQLWGCFICVGSRTGLKYLSSTPWCPNWLTQHVGHQK